ncbi:hypothetical protein BH23PLA1_BH23PLA1_27450 [soil metagenome]
MPTNEARITQLRGYAWFVFRDPTTSTGPAGEQHPFGEEPVEEGAEPEVRLPEGVLDAWRTTSTTVGLGNRAPGTDFVVVTERSEPPEVNAGWDVEPAQLQDNFQMEQKGDRWVRLQRVLQKHEGTGGKSLLHCEFEVDRNWQGSGRDSG